MSDYGVDFLELPHDQSRLETEFSRENLLSANSHQNLDVPLESSFNLNEFYQNKPMPI